MVLMRNIRILIVIDTISLQDNKRSNLTTRETIVYIKNKLIYYTDKFVLSLVFLRKL